MDHVTQDQLPELWLIESWELTRDVVLVVCVVNVLAAADGDVGVGEASLLVLDGVDQVGGGGGQVLPLAEVLEDGEELAVEDSHIAHRVVSQFLHFRPLRVAGDSAEEMRPPHSRNNPQSVQCLPGHVSRRASE